jgi:hypothetical protein
MELWRISRIVVLPAMAGVLLSMAVTMLSLVLPSLDWFAHILTYLILLVTLYAGFRAGKAKMDYQYSALAGALTYLLMILVDNTAFFLAFGHIGNFSIVPLFTVLCALLGLAGGILARRKIK